MELIFEWISLWKGSDYLVVGDYLFNESNDWEVMIKVAFFFCLEKKSGGSTCVLT